MSWATELFGTDKAIIAMLHLGPLPGDPFYKGSMDDVVNQAKADLKALQDGGVDGILITNEFSGPFLEKTENITIAAMCRVFGELKADIRVPYGIESIHDGNTCVELCAATDSSFTRCLFHGTWISDQGVRQHNIARTLRTRVQLRQDDLKLCYFVYGEGSKPLEEKTLAARAKSLLGSCRAEMLVVPGGGPGRPPAVDDIREVKSVAGDTPVFCGTGCNIDNCEAILAVADGAYVGSTFKAAGAGNNPIDPARVAAFMAKVKALRK